MAMVLASRIPARCNFHFTSMGRCWDLKSRGEHSSLSYGANKAARSCPAFTVTIEQHCIAEQASENGLPRLQVMVMGVQTQQGERRRRGENRRPSCNPATATASRSPSHATVSLDEFLQPSLIDSCKVNLNRGFS